VDRVDGSWGVIDSNDFNLFTRCFRKLFRKERIHLLGTRCRGNPKIKINTERMSFFMLCIQYLSLVYCSFEELMH
jgi:hypothetical protein